MQAAETGAAHVPSPRPDPHQPVEPGWAARIATALADPAEPRLVFQPIVDVRRGVVAGYEALARFSGPPTPDRWFAAADRLGVGARLEARVVAAGLTARDRLPAGCFVTVNVSPHLLCEPELADLLLGAGDLSRLVLELTEHVRVDDHDRLLDLLSRLKAAGVTVALDDAGAGYAGLQQLALFRPDVVKIDRALVDHADRDEVKLALAELLGSYAGRLDAVVVAEGVERPEELEAFARLGVPLAQGWLFGRPGPGWPQLSADQAEWLRSLEARRRRVDEVALLVERTPSVAEDDLDSAGLVFAADPGLELAAVLDKHQRAVCLLRRQPHLGGRLEDLQVLPVSLRVTDTADLAEVAFRAMTRSPAARFDPVICSNGDGSYLGVIRPERLMLRLAELKASTRSVDTSLGRLRLVDP